MDHYTTADEQAVSAQLRRLPRGVLGVGYRCPCGSPAVVITAPRLPDGTPFPTLYYTTCPRLNGALSTLESEGFMTEQAEVLKGDEALAKDYRAAHDRYLAERSVHGEIPQIAGVSAGGMPDRVKCLHALAGQSLACGPGVNPVGDAALTALGAWWDAAGCVEEEI